MNNDSTPARIVLLTMQILMEDDIDMDELFADSGVPMEQLLDDEGVVTINDVLVLTQKARAMTGDPAMGLHWGQQLGIEVLDMVGMLASTAPSMREALMAVTQHLHQVIDSLGHVELVEEGDSARLVVYLAQGLEPLNLHSMEFVSSSVWNIGRRLVKGELSFQRINFQGSAPAWLDEYPRVFGDDVEFVFNAPENSIVMDRRQLDLPMARHTPGLYQHLLEQAAKRLASRPQTETTAATVKRLIDEHISEHRLDLPVLAEFMGLTPRTLQRRLKEENTTFQSIYDEHRRQLAEEWLLNGSTNIDTIAVMLGYSEPANFYRAFKGWSGLSPSEFKRRQGVR